MKARIVGGGTAQLGATRYKIEWITIKSDVNTQDGIDPDTDCVFRRIVSTHSGSL
jgi:hypothetical protein